MALLSALAWHRVTPFANPVIHQKILFSSAANTFKKTFQTDFKPLQI